MSAGADAGTVLAATRAAIGTAAWATPVLASRLFGVDIREDVGSVLYLRLGGTRDFALARATHALAGDARVTLLKIGVAVDLGDVAAVALARRNGEISKAGAALFIASSLSCAALGVAALAGR
jgi:hypothetical protein